MFPAKKRQVKKKRINIIIHAIKQGPSKEYILYGLHIGVELWSASGRFYSPKNSVGDRTGD